MPQEASFTFTTPLNVNLVEIKGVEHLFVEGDISTNDIDLVNDVMTKECQESMQKQILDRNMKLDIEHEAFKGSTEEEKEIAKTKIPAGKLVDATVKDLGSGRYSTRVKGEINVHNPNYKSIKGNLMDSYLDAFSVAFLPTSVTNEQREGKSVRLLNDVKLLNVALTGNPCNTKAQLTEIFTKSMDAVEEYKKLKEFDPSIENSLVVKNNDSKADLVGDNKLNSIKNSNKMTDNNDEATAPEENEAEAESIDANEVAVKAMSVDLKALNDKYEVVAKEHVDLKESMKAISESLSKITEALNKPVHKSEGVKPTDAELNAKPEAKSVDPLAVFK